MIITLYLTKNTDWPNPTTIFKIIIITMDCWLVRFGSVRSNGSTDGDDGLTLHHTMMPEDEEHNTNNKHTTTTTTKKINIFSLYSFQTIADKLVNNGTHYSSSVSSSSFFFDCFFLAFVRIYKRLNTRHNKAKITT